MSEPSLAGINSWHSCSDNSVIVRVCVMLSMHRRLRNSMNLIQATYACDGEQVAEYIEKAHLETSILQYNNENALAYTIYLAYIMARNDHFMAWRKFQFQLYFLRKYYILPLKEPTFRTLISKYRTC